MLDTYLQDIFSMMTIQTLSLMSPGPDFAVVTKESLIRGRSFGLTAALGITCGVFFHLTYIYFGLANLIVANRNVFIVFKFFGIVYLAYLGFSSIFSRYFCKSDTNKIFNITLIYWLACYYFNNLFYFFKI